MQYHCWIVCRQYATGLAVSTIAAIAGGFGAKHAVVIKSTKAIKIARKVYLVIVERLRTLTQLGSSISAERYLSESPPSAAVLALRLPVNSGYSVSVAVAARSQAQAVRACSCYHLARRLSLAVLQRKGTLEQKTCQYPLRCTYPSAL